MSGPRRTESGGLMSAAGSSSTGTMGPPPSEKAESLDALSKEELIRRLKEATAAPRPKAPESQRREQLLFMRLTAKEQEVQEYLGQMEELRAWAGPGLRSALLDPVLSSLFAKLKAELRHLKAALEKSQQEQLAWKFTPDSTTGKRLMAKCRGLISENAELGSSLESGRVAELEGQAGLLREAASELRAGQAEVDELLVDLDEDCEGLQATVVFLQKELEAARAENVRLSALLPKEEDRTANGCVQDGPPPKAAKLLNGD